jgi:hypothetical protein
VDPVSQLLHSALNGLFVAVLLLMRAIRKKFATDPDKPTINEGIIYGVALILSLALCYAQNSVSPPDITSVVDLWWVQGILFFGALFIADVGVDATSIKTQKAQEQIAVANTPPSPKTEGGGA